MEKTKGTWDTPENARRGDDGYEGKVDESSQLDELEKIKKLLVEENERCKNEIEDLTAEIKGIDIFVRSAEGQISSYDKRTKEHLGELEKLESKRESLFADISDIKLRIKADREDEKSVLALRNSLADELDDMKSDKAIIVERLNELKKGIREISGDEERRLPHLKDCDEMLRKAYHVVKKAETKMEIAIMLRQK